MAKIPSINITSPNSYNDGKQLENEISNNDNREDSGNYHYYGKGKGKGKNSYRKSEPSIEDDS